jgi:hypothetical protein
MKDMRIPRSVLPAPIVAAFLGTLAMPVVACAYSITSFELNEPVALKLRDGRQVTGRYRGAVGAAKDSTAYPERYEDWRGASGPQSAPALGESLVVTRESAGSWRGAFGGFAGRAMLLGTPDSGVYQLVPLDKHVSVRRASEPIADSDWLAARKRWKSGPSMYVIAVQTDDASLAVPATMLAERAALPRPGSSVTRGVLVGLLIGTVLVSIAVAAALASSFSEPLL